ncbi:MAG: NUDIX domain-containing protein [Nocardioidaceae bacterium]
MNSFASVVLVDRRGWILLQERDEFPVIDPEKWGLVGGHLDGDEDPRTGAVRELAEETGVRLAPEELTPWRSFDVFHEAYGSVDRMWVFAAACDLTDDDIVLGEGRRIVFVAPDEARGLDLTEGARAAVPVFLDSELYASMSS